MYYQIGPVTLRQVGLGPDTVRMDGEHDFASKPVLGREPPLEDVGEGQNTLTLSGTLFPRKIGGLTEYAILDQHRYNGTPVFILRGDLFPLGWYRITSASREDRLLDRSGIGRVIAVNLKFVRADKPPASRLFELLVGLFA